LAAVIALRVQSASGATALAAVWAASAVSKLARAAPSWWARIQRYGESGLTPAGIS
jgi:hypothetical protein